jgi:hypothetical protein
MYRLISAPKLQFFLRPWFKVFLEQTNQSHQGGKRAPHVFVKLRANGSSIPRFHESCSTITPCDYLYVPAARLVLISPPCNWATWAQPASSPILYGHRFAPCGYHCKVPAEQNGFADQRPAKISWTTASRALPPRMFRSCLGSTLCCRDIFR